MNDTNKEFIFISNKVFDERIMINRSAYKRYHREGWEMDAKQFGNEKPKKTRKPRQKKVEAPVETDGL